MKIQKLRPFVNFGLSLGLSLGVASSAVADDCNEQWDKLNVLYERFSASEVEINNLIRPQDGTYSSLNTGRDYLVQIGRWEMRLQRNDTWFLDQEALGSDETHRENIEGYIETLGNQIDAMSMEQYDGKKSYTEHEQIFDEIVETQLAIVWECPAVADSPSNDPTEGSGNQPGDLANNDNQTGEGSGDEQVTDEPSDEAADEASSVAVDEPEIDQSESSDSVEE